MRKVEVVAFVVVIFGFAGMLVAAGGPVDPAGFTKGMSVDKPASSPHADGWVPLERAGGETCATATIVPALPYLDSGSTAAAIHDYDEACPYTGGTAPDVVYSYTPATNMTVDISLCSGLPETDYDSKLYVYQDACPDGGPFACDDDGCSTSLTSFASNVLGLALNAGSTYYIVVDGYGTSSGNYTIEMTEGVPWASDNPCDPADLLFGQDPSNTTDGWGASSSTQAAWSATSYAVYDNFVSDYFQVCDLHFYGLSLFHDGAGFNACDPYADGGMTFTAAFYLDNGSGQPDTAAPICEYTGLAPAVTDTGDFYSIDNMYAFDVAALPTCCDLPASGTIWVMIQNEPMATADCGFLWMSSENGLGDNGWQFDGAGLVATDYDFGMCLTGDTWPVELQSFSID